MPLTGYNETPRAREACDRYLELGATRSLAKLVASSMDDPEGPYSLVTLKDWSRFFHWTARAKQYDQELRVARRKATRDYIIEAQDKGVRARVSAARFLVGTAMKFMDGKTLEDLATTPLETGLALQMLKDGLKNERADLPSPTRGDWSDDDLPHERTYDAHEIEVFESIVLEVIEQEAPHVRGAIEQSLRRAFVGDQAGLLDVGQDGQQEDDSVPV